MSQPGHRRQFPLDAFDTAVLLVLAGLSVWLLAFLLQKTSPTHVWLGLDGPNAGDQLQYLGWIQQSSRHVLVASPFDTAPARADFLSPGIAISGVLVRFGVSPSLSYYLWVPVAVVTLFVAVRLFVRRVIEGTARRRCALVLALFYVSPTWLLAPHLLGWLPPVARFWVQSVVTDMWPVSYLWGYPFAALSLACLCLALLTYERDRKALRFRPWAPLLGLLCAWLMPWQGATLLGVVVVSEAIMWLRGHRTGPVLPAATAAATALPLAYYAMLSHIDPAWAVAGRVNALVIPASTFIVALIPLGLPALLAYRLRPDSFQQVSVRIWPVVALAQIWFTSVTHIGTFAVHAVEGLSIPFSVLAVIGVCSLRLRLPEYAKVVIAVALVGVLIVPSGIQALNIGRAAGDSIDPGEPMFIQVGEWSALNYLKNDPAAGSVLSPVDLGEAVPAVTGRLTWVGIDSYTPSFKTRSALTNELFSGGLQPAQATRLIQSSRATFLLADCQHRADLATLLPAVVEPGKRFGCATVYRVRSGH